VPQIEVTFDIDANGIVNVSAKDKGTGKQQQIRIQASGGLSEADIQKMVKEAEAHAAEDKKRRALVEARNQAESLIHLTEKTLAEHGDKLNAADKAAIEKALSDLKSAIGGEDSAQIEARSHALTQASTKLGEAVYATSQPQPGGAGDKPATSQGASGDEKVVDAEFEEVDERKRSQG
jgi:molecular chaperone DnaK